MDYAAILVYKPKLIARIEPVTDGIEMTESNFARGDAPSEHSVRGKPLSRTGKETVARILDTACEILRTEGYERFSMQGIAKRLGRRLSNIQYYFKTRDDLIRAVIQRVEQTYDRHYEQTLAQAGDSPEGRFRAVIEFNFFDSGNTDTRHFFIQLWPLLSTADNYSGELMRRLYISQLQQFAERIQELTPGLDMDEALIRAEMIAAMFEGLMVTAPASMHIPDHGQRLRERLVETAFAIARRRDPIAAADPDIPSATP